MRDAFQDGTAATERLDRHAASKARGFFNVFRAVHIRGFLRVAARMFIRRVTRVNLIYFGRYARFLREGQNIGGCLACLGLMRCAFVCVAVRLTGIYFLSNGLLFPLPLNDLRGRDLLSLKDDNHTFASRG